jgi:kumamolisin
MNSRKVFQGSIVPLPVETGLTSNGLMVQNAEASHLKEVMPVLFSLEIPADKRADLEKKVVSGTVLTPAELNSGYAANPDDVSALTDWLKQEGFEITKISSNGTSVYTRASVSQIQKSLEVNMVRVTKDGLAYTAAQNAPSLPADVGKGVHAIIGLQPFRQARKHFRMRVPKHANRIPEGSANSPAIGPAPQIDNAPPYVPSEIMKAYNADSLGTTGAGQTIAILIDTFPNDNDLTAFWTNNNLPTTLDQIEKVNVTGRALPTPEGEETLDAEWSSGVAPGAQIRIYASGSLQFVDLDLALDQIFDDLSTIPGMRQLSISLGLGETYLGGPDGEVATQHQKFLKLSAAGVNIFVSSGDAGSNPDSTGHSPTGPLQAEHPSSDPFVVGVGGTSLTLSASGDIDSERGWASGGGGQSIYFQRPAWQSGDGVPAGSMRLVPDVSLTADPDLGAYLIFNGNLAQFGGTSWSAPVWAGFCALMNEARLRDGKTALSFLNPLIYPLIGSGAFRDITAGSNGAYMAGAGYDMVTGVGVPDVHALFDAIN